MMFLFQQDCETLEQSFFFFFIQTPGVRVGTHTNTHTPNGILVLLKLTVR